jgi:hypothetical protein
VEYNKDDIGPFHDKLKAPSDELLAKARPLIESSEKPPRHLYHYTSLQGMMGIVESQTLWATDARYLNDAKELIWAKEVFGQALIAAETHSEAERDFVATLNNTHGLSDIGFRVFCTSFSEADDDLGQWRGYGSGTDGGVSLGISSSKMMYKLPEAMMLPILYDAEQQAAIAQKIVAMMLDFFRSNLEESPIANAFFVPHCIQLFRQMTVIAALRFKASYWSGEKEWRLITFITSYGRDELHKLDFRQGRLGMTPYIKLPFPVEAYRKGVPIERLVLGPSLYPDLSLESIRLYMQKHGYELHKGLEASSIPLR